MDALAGALARLVAPDGRAARAAVEHHDRLTKPRGALGRVEQLGIQLAAIARQCPPPVPEPVAVAVFAGDHGVVAQGVTPWPSQVTAQMVANFLAGGAAINVLARLVGARVTVVDVGMATNLPGAAGLRRAKVRRGTADLATGPAMTAGEAAAALAVGVEVAADLVDAGARLLVTGDMGIGNTTAAAALIAALTGLPAAEVTGRGTGIDDAMLARKIEVVDRAVARVATLGDPTVPPVPERGMVPGVGPVAVLAEIGGLEIGALAGFVIGGAAARVPVVVDGVIALAAACVAHALDPRVTAYCVAGHRSPEPGAGAALAHLGLEPVLDLGMRLGEGTGACLAVPIVQAAARVLAEMATFDAAGVTPRR